VAEDNVNPLRTIKSYMMSYLLMALLVYPTKPSKYTMAGVVNLSGRGMLVVSVARQLRRGNSFARLLCCPTQAERGRKKAL